MMASMRLPDSSRRTRLWSPTSPSTNSACRHRPAEPGREIVEDDDIFASIEQLEHHMAADIAGAACDQNTHDNLTTSGLQFAACYRI